MRQKMKRYMATALLAAWGGMSFFVLCSEDAPGREMSLTTFLVSKALALASLYGCAMLYRSMARKGIIKW